MARTDTTQILHFFAQSVTFHMICTIKSDIFLLILVGLEMRKKENKCCSKRQYIYCYGGGGLGKFTALRVPGLNSVVLLKTVG
jgi:hypothetical protein